MEKLLKLEKRLLGIILSSERCVDSYVSKFGTIALEPSVYKSRKFHESTYIFKDMSLLMHPMFETNALDRIYDRTDLFNSEFFQTSAFMEPAGHKPNGIYDGINLLSSETLRPSAFVDIRAMNSRKVPVYTWENPNILRESPKHVSAYYKNEFTDTSSCKNLWTRERPRLSPTCKSTELWRPFSSPPRNEALPSSHVLERRSKSSSNLPVITPSTVKIGASKSSVFEPVKKKKYTCSNCSSAFTNGVQLKSHLRKHKGVKPYKCEYPNCPKTFARNEELTRHRRIHSGYKPYHCHVCGKSFCRKDHLSKHLKTHLQISEKRVYVCCFPGCEHRYTRSDALTRHKTTAHSVNSKSR